MIPKTIVGFDYSLTCPCWCVMKGFEDVYSGHTDYDCMFYYITPKKKYQGTFLGNIIGYESKEYNDPVERFKNLSDTVLDCLQENYQLDDKQIFMEGYSFGSKGRAVFQIAENGGILKYRLQLHYGQVEVIPPANIKKFATGKGNADKMKMYEQFKKDTKIDLMKAFDQQTLANPVTDIVDAYYIAKYGQDIKSKTAR